MKHNAPSSIWRKLAVLSGLGLFAFVAPVLDLYGKNPEVFVANRTSSLEIFTFAIAVALFVPAVSMAVLGLAGLVGPRTAVITYHSMAGLLSLGTGFVVTRQLWPDNTWGAAIGALALAAGLFWLVRNFDVVLFYAALAIPVLAGVFLLTSDTSRLIWVEPEPVVGAAEVVSPSNLVMIQLDEMPLASILDTDANVNEALFPNFARLEKEGTWYRNAFSNSIATTQSVPSILTGLNPEPDASPSFVDHPDNLFTLLGPSYDMHVIEWVAELCPADVCPEYAGRAPARFSNLLGDVVVVYGHLTLPGSLRERLPSIDNSWRGFLGQDESAGGGGRIEVDGLPVPDDSTRQDWVDWVQRLINGIDSKADPTFSYAHLRAPHVPWVTNPSGTHYVRPEQYTEVAGVEGDGHWSTTPGAALLGYQRYLSQVGFVDRLLGRLFDKLDQTGTWDDTMIVVVADHGASFVPGEHRRWPYENNREDLYRIPLFIKYPGQSQGETVDLPAFGIDVAPTVVDALDVQTDWQFDGESLLQLDHVREHEPTRWCCNGDGVSTDLASLYAQIERDHEWIPDQSSWIGVAGAGPYAGLVGTEVAGAVYDNNFQWSLDLGSELKSVDRSSGKVQTVLSGRVVLPDDSGTDILVLLNHVVAGMGYVARDSSDGGTLSAFVTEELVNDGPNDLDILLADGKGGWIVGLSTDLTLDLVAEDGHVLDVVAEGGKRIQVDDAKVVRDSLELRGWAADVNNKATPDMIYVFAGDQLLAEGPPNVDNNNVVRWFGSDDLLTSGFDIDVALADVPTGIEQVLVVAEFSGQSVADSVTIPG